MLYRMGDRRTSCFFYCWYAYNNEIIILIDRVQVCAYKSTCSCYIWLRRQYPPNIHTAYTRNNRRHSTNLYRRSLYVIHTIVDSNNRRRVLWGRRRPITLLIFWTFGGLHYIFIRYTLL